MDKYIKPEMDIQELELQNAILDNSTVVYAEDEVDSNNFTWE